MKPSHLFINSDLPELKGIQENTPQCVSKTCSVRVKLISESCRSETSKLSSVKSLNYSEILAGIQFKQMSHYRGIPCVCVLFLGQPQLQDQGGKFLCQLWVSTHEVDQRSMVKVERREALAGGERLADAIQRSLE